MSIRAVFRVQCDGPCRGWLSWSEDYVPGTPILPRHEVVAPTAERAFNWPGERAARTAALAAGWVRSYVDSKDRTHPRWLCPTCKLNPLGIRLPSNPVCVCTHDLIWHEGKDAICKAIPGVLGCGCLGFLRKETGS